MSSRDLPRSDGHGDVADSETRTRRHRLEVRRHMSRTPQPALDLDRMLRGFSGTHPDARRRRHRRRRRCRLQRRKLRCSDGRGSGGRGLAHNDHLLRLSSAARIAARQASRVGGSFVAGMTAVSLTICQIVIGSPRNSPCTKCEQADEESQSPATQSTRMDPRVRRNRKGCGDRRRAQRTVVDLTIAVTADCSASRVTSPARTARTRVDNPTEAKYR